MNQTSQPNGFDPLRASTPLPFQHVLFPFGFPAHIKSNEAAVIKAAELSWSAFRPRFREAPIEVRVLVSEAPFRRCPSPPVFRAQANLLAIVADAHNFASCDLAGGHGFACVTHGALNNSEYFRYHFLDAMVYSLLDTRHFVAVHAACVVKNDRGVLLVGESGAGKSSLAYACARRGWTYISDDATSVLRSGSARLAVGNPHTFRFRPAASSLFPELRGPVKGRNGKPTVEISTKALPHINVAHECSIDFVIFLNRLSAEVDAATIQPVSREYALRTLIQNPWPAELRIDSERLGAIERLLEAHLYQLTYMSFDPAIDVLEDLIAQSVNP